MTQPAYVIPPIPSPNPYGVDIWLGSVAGGPVDADPTLRTTGGRQLLSQNLLCRLTSPRGTVIDCPNDGLDVRDLLSSGQTPVGITQINSAIQAEVMKDQRVTACLATTVYNSATSSMTVTLGVTSSYGPFALVLAVSAVSVSILQANLPANTTL